MSTPSKMKTLMMDRALVPSDFNTAISFVFSVTINNSVHKMQKLATAIAMQKTGQWSSARTNLVLARSASSDARESSPTRASPRMSISAASPFSRVRAAAALSRLFSRTDTRPCCTRARSRARRTCCPG